MLTILFALYRQRRISNTFNLTKSNHNEFSLITWLYKMKHLYLLEYCVNESNSASDLMGCLEKALIDECRNVFPHFQAFCLWVVDLNIPHPKPTLKYPQILGDTQKCLFAVKNALQKPFRESRYHIPKIKFRQVARVCRKYHRTNAICHVLTEHW